MVNESRISVYNFLKEAFKAVTQNVYSMRVPTENTSDDTKNGFIVIEVGGIYDDSEFSLETYGEVRCYVTAYVPQKTRGRLDETLYSGFENGINAVVHSLTDTPHNDSPYYVVADSILSMDDDEDTNKGNQYNVFVKSFVVVINE